MKSVKRFIPFAVIFVFVVMFHTISASASSGNLLMNPGGEEGMNYWTDPDDAWETESSTVAPFNGVFFWPKKKDLPTTMIYQDVPISNYIGQKLTFSAYTRDYMLSHGDESMIRLELIDFTGTVLSKKEASNKNNDQWKELKVSETIPDNAVTARVSFVGIRHFGSGLDSYFDEAMLTVDGNTENLPVPVPEPTFSNQAELSYLQLTLRKGQKAYLGAVITHNTKEKIKWLSIQPKVASVNKKGVVKAKSKGYTMIHLRLGNSRLEIRIKVID